MIFLPIIVAIDLINILLDYYIDFCDKQSYIGPIIFLISEFFLFLDILIRVFS